MSEVVRQINTSLVQVLEDSENIDVGQYSKTVIFSLASSMQEGDQHFMFNVLVNKDN